MELVYNKAIKSLEENIDDYKLKQKDPQELARKLEEKKRELTDLDNRMNGVTEKISRRYQSNDGIIKKEADTAIAVYKSEIGKIEGNSDKSLDELEKISFRQIDKFHEFQKQLQVKVVDECNEKLQVTVNDSVIKFDILKPDFTKEMVDKIKTDMKGKAYIKETYEDGITFTKTKTRSVFSQQKYFDLVKGSIIDRIEEIKKDVISDLRSFVGGLILEYKKELQNNIDDYTNKKDQIAKDKMKAEDIGEKIKFLREVLATMQADLKVVRELKGGIDGNL